MDSDLQSLLAIYEANGDEAVYDRARPRYEQAIAQSLDPRLLLDYGYLLYCHGRYAIGRAVEQYERAIALDADAPQARYQLIQARAALGDVDTEITQYQQRVTVSPRDVREYRYLAAAHLAAGNAAEAGKVVAAGLALAPEDPQLIEFRGDVRAATGDPDGALADWRHSLRLNPESISALYSTAFLLERQHRPEEAVQAWTAIRDWATDHGNTLDTEWPTREINRLAGHRLP